MGEVNLTNVYKDKEEEDYNYEEETTTTMTNKIMMKIMTVNGMKKMSKMNDY